MGEHAILAKEIQALEFDTVFRIVNGTVVELDRNARELSDYAPNVYHSPTNDIDIDGHGDWKCLTGMTGQYSYHGAVMHPSEFVGEGIADYLNEYAEACDDCLFALVVVYVHDEDMDSPDDDDMAGWAIAYREIVR